MMGAANIWWVPLANTFGRRPITLLNLLILVFCSMWAGLATSFESLLAARFFMGVGVGPADTSTSAVVLVSRMGSNDGSCAECDRRDILYASEGEGYGMCFFLVNLVVAKSH